MYQRENIKPKQLREKLSELASRLTEEGANKYKELIDKIASGDSKKSPLVEIDYVSVTKSEIDSILELDGTIEQRLAFTMLCLAKFRNSYIENNMNWEVYEFKDIYSMANINIKTSDRTKYINNLVVKEYIKPSKKITNVNYQVMFVNDNSPEVLKVEDFRDLGNILLSYLGEEFDRCEICGRLIKHIAKTKHRKYCDACRKRYSYEKTASKNMYVPVNLRPIKTKCKCCGKEIYINPSLLWLDSMCENCKT